MTKLKNGTLMTEYAEIMAAIKSLESKRDAIKMKLVADFAKEGIEKVEHPAGVFSLTNMSRWTYSKKIDDMQEKIKLAQIREQEKGIAKASVTTTIRFTPVKD